MKSIFRPNLRRGGRLARGLGAAVLLSASALLLERSGWLSLVLAISGGFLLFEALRGWCLLRACGIKTKF